MQHPTFRYELRGAGKLPLNELPLPSQSRSTLVFPAGRTYVVMAGNDRGPVVGEVSDVARARRMSVRAGRYFVRGRTSDALLEGEIDANGTVDVTDDRLRRVAYTWPFPLRAGLFISVVGLGFAAVIAACAPLVTAGLRSIGTPYLVPAILSAFILLGILAERSGRI